MRELSETIKTVLAQDYAETRDAVIITIPEQQGAVVYPETTLYFANGEGVVLDGKSFDNRLRAIGAIKFSLGKAPDNTEITIENVSRELGFTLTDFQRVLDGSKVQIIRGFKTSDTSWETDILFTGYVRDTRVSQDTISLSLTSDMSRRGTSVAGRPLTQRCIFRFNVNGSGVGPLCGWSLGQPGNPLSCDKGLDTPNGCQAHGNQHRFGGVPAFTNLTSGNGYDYTGGGWGQGSGGGWCISADSLVLVESQGAGLWVKAKDLKNGGYSAIISIDPEGRFVPAKISNLEYDVVDRGMYITTAQGFKITCTEEHGIMQKYSSSNAVSAKELKLADTVLIYDYEKHQHSKDRIEEIGIIHGFIDIVKISLESPYHLYIAGETEKGAIVSHNNKPILTDPHTRQYQTTII